MKGVLTVAGLALVGYALYEWLYGSAAVPAASTTATSTTTTPASTPAPAVNQTTRSLMVAWANANGFGGQLLTAWQWGYIYKKVRGVDANFQYNQAWPGYSGTNAKLLSVDEWLAASTAAGFSGLRGFTSQDWRTRISRTLTAGLGDFNPGVASRMARGLTVN